MQNVNSTEIPLIIDTVVIGGVSAFSTKNYSSNPVALNVTTWDGDANLSANSFIAGYATTATSGSTTSLSANSAQQQYFTGSTTQTVTMPLTLTLALGQTFRIVNNSTGVVTVQSSGGNTIQAMASNTSLILTVINTAVTTAAAWDAQYVIDTALTLPLSLANGGTNASLTASNGGIFYSTATSGAILSGTATGNQLLLSGASTTPQWSTSTYPTTNAINTLLYASAANTMAALATANNGTLITSNTGVPSISSTLPAAVQGNITTLGTITSGTWNGNAITVAYGGTSNTSQPAYSLVAGGTTTTGAFQSINPVATGQVLVSSGTTALPAFSATPTVTSITFGTGSALGTYVSRGSFTPGFSFGGGTTGIVYTNQTGVYTQIGSIIVFTLTISTSSKGTSTGAANVTGLPVNSNGAGQVAWCQTDNITYPTSVTSIFINFSSGTKNATVDGTISAAAFTGLTDTNFANSSTLRCTGFYLG